MRPTTRRVPRRIEEDGETILQNDGLALDDDGPVVKRPVNSSRTSLKPKKASTLRTSFASLQLPEDDVGEPTNTFKPPAFRPSSQRAKSLKISASERMRLVTRLADDRPTYDSNHLLKLKNDTASTPHTTENNTSASDSVLAPRDLDIGSKFGDSDLGLATALEDPVTHIPSESEIRENKERRKRLANEQNYVSLSNKGSNEREEIRKDDSDESVNQDPDSYSLIIPADEAFVPSKYGETRLVHEDEDMAEGFDEFVEDAGQVSLGRNAARAQERQRRKDMEDQIRSAQQGYGYSALRESSEEDDVHRDDETTRNAAYDAVQMRAGTYGIGKSYEKDIGEEERLKQSLELPKFKVIPDFKAVIVKFSSVVSAKGHEIEDNKKKLAKLQQELEEITEDSARVQKLLSEAGERYENLKLEVIQEPINALTTSNGSAFVSLASMRPVSGLESRQAPHGQLQLHDSSEIGRIPAEEDEYSS